MPSITNGFLASMDWAASAMLPRASPPSYVAACSSTCTMYHANSQPVAYVVCLSSSPWVLSVEWNSLTNSSSAKATSLTSLTYWTTCVPSPVSPWSIRGWKNWLNEAHVPDMITIGFHAVFFSSSAIACVQNTPDVSISTTSASVAAIVVNWL